MSNMGASTGDEPDFVDDGDLKTVDELRGAYKRLVGDEMSHREKATVRGLMAEVDVVKQQIAMQAEQMNRLIGMYQTLQAEFTQYKQQRIVELQMKVNGGSTSRED